MSEDLGRLVATLEAGATAFASLPDAVLLDAWSDTVETFLDPGSRERRELEGALAHACRLSPQGLAAGLEAVLGGVERSAAGRVLERAAAARRGISAGREVGLPDATREADRPAGAGERQLPQREGQERSAPDGAGKRRLVVVFLASNLPALAVQPLLPALALRLPVLLKSPSAEPLFAPAFVAALSRREPRLAPVVAAATWPGGDAAVEEPVLSAAAAVVAYGDEPALASLGLRVPGRLLGYGPKTSLAVVGRGVPPEEVAAGLARDIALFDQRGCLSLAAVFQVGGPREAGLLARGLAAELARLAEEWPPGPLDLNLAAAVQQARLAAELRGLEAVPLPPLPIANGTVLVDPVLAFNPLPPLRAIRIHPLADLDRLPEVLTPWRGRLQGAALAGPDAWCLAPRLAGLGISRCAAPGLLQSPDASWHNGGIDPLLRLLPLAPPLPDEN